MQESSKNDFALKKAYEIAYAVFRIAANIKEPVLARQLKNSGALVLGSVVREKYGDALKNLAALEYFVRFSMDVNIMGIKNGEIMVHEIAGLQGTLSSVGVMEEEPAIDIAGIFSKSEPVKRNPINQENQKPPENGSSAIRQAAILERIRQIGNCRIKDIEDILPESSERTIRYDLQALLEKKLIERIGTGGPAVYYRVRTLGEGISG